MSRRDKTQQKRKKKLEQRRKRALRVQEHARTLAQVVAREPDQLIREIDHVIGRAEARSTTVVTLGVLVFFSTDTGDAWVLDAEDRYALCLARNGDRQTFNVVETVQSYQIEWTARFTIEGEAFVVTENSGGVRSIVGYPTDTIEAHCRLALQSELPPGSRPEAQRRAGRFPSGPIDWELALRGVPSRDVFAGLDLANPSNLDEAVSIFCSMLEEGTFAQWEDVIREEAALPHSDPRRDGLDEPIDVGNDEVDDRILFIDDLPRPHEPWYRTLQRLASALLNPVIRTDHDYCDAVLDGWRVVEDYLEGCAEGLALPAGARDPLDVLAPGVVHRLRVRSCVSDLVGIGQDFRPGLTLANEEEQHRVDELLTRLREQRASVEFLQLTLERLTQLFELPPGEDILLVNLLIARLGPMDPREPLAARLGGASPRSEKGRDSQGGDG